jgi:hypothetical protein
METVFSVGPPRGYITGNSGSWNPLTLSSRTVPVPQLPVSKSNSSQRLNCSSPLTAYQPVHFTPLYSTALHSQTRQLTTSLHSTDLTLLHSTPYVASGTDHTENTVLLLRACMLRPLPSNSRCLQSHQLVTGLHATIYCGRLRTRC